MFMSNDPKNQKGPSGKLLLILALIAVVIGVILTMQTREKPAPLPVEKVAEARTTESQNSAPVRPETPAPVTEEEKPEPEENAQRAYLVEDFRDTKKNWSKYKLENTVLTPEGIKLQDGQTEGTFEAPCTALKLPANMVALLWKETLPDGTVVKPELQ